MSLHIGGINITLPLDMLGTIFAKLRFDDGVSEFRKGSRYQINGEWFVIEQVLKTGLIMRLVNPNGIIRERE